MSRLDERDSVMMIGDCMNLAEHAIVHNILTMRVMHLKFKAMVDDEVATRQHYRQWPRLLNLSNGGGDAPRAAEAKLHDVGELAVGVGHRLVVADDQPLQGVG